MRILFLHPEDSPRRGPWSTERWDLIVDLGRSSAFSAGDWSGQYSCPILRSDTFSEDIADAKLVRQIFSAGRGTLIDEEGIDWWDLTSLLLVPELMTVLALRRMAAEINRSAELWTTRAGGPARFLALVLDRDIRPMGNDAGLSARAKHYTGILRRLSAPQIKEILLDKYDSGYRWRSRLSSTARPQNEPVVLLPSAYGNVSRTAAAYASLLPAEKFLLVATRPSARRFDPPENVAVQDLGAYAKQSPPAAEIVSLCERWRHLRAVLSATAELDILLRAGEFQPIPDWIRDGVIARNAWREVLRREPIRAVLCGDDSNRYTRLPVLLAASRKIPTVDFHHGALDGRYLVKDLPCDVYLAKNEVERDYLVRTCGLSESKTALGAPPEEDARSLETTAAERKSPVFFSEPYEIVGVRTEEVYREVLPPLCGLVRERGGDVVLKLHPFENLSQRERLVREILKPDDASRIRVIDGPITAELMAEAWFGITVESTTVIDCLRNGVRCFLCSWLKSSSYGYMQQFARFGIGEALPDAMQIKNIGVLLAKAPPIAAAPLRVPLNPSGLHQLLRSASRERESLKTVS
ncbi:MAG TPA: hypothetical protein VMH04_08620 [Candidatus Solibacter sp.]|nr:hypothetical protein [Candidatus Solibacter sp.]